MQQQRMDDEADAFVLLVEVENGVLRATWQAKAGDRGAAPPWGTVLPVPEGARAEACPTAEEFLQRPTLHGAEARKAVIFSLGVIHLRHFLGRSFRNLSMRLSAPFPIPRKEDFLGCSLRTKPLVFSLVPRSQE